MAAPTRSASPTPWAWGVDMIKHGLIEKIRSDYARMAAAAPESRAAAV